MRHTSFALENLVIEVLRASFGSLIVGSIVAVHIDPEAGATATAIAVVPCFVLYRAADAIARVFSARDASGAPESR
jgi:1,4-dihydroxy-2-naphthoate octaprenyltransferase